MSKYHDILKQYWGYDNFRSLQEEIIQSVGDGNDTLGLMPTGGGKSIAFQVPAMAMEGVCLVVTPLVALMKDQVDNLKKKRIKAVAVYSGMSRDEITVALENCIYGDYKFLYVSPERLGTELFLSRLQAMKVCLIAVDESHCISQWGYDFRPSYLQIAQIREYLPHVPVLALTATATPEVAKDIQRQLKFQKENIFQKSYERKNLAYVVRYAEDKQQSLLSILNAVQGTAVVYVRDRKKTKEVALYLSQNGITSEHFHAGLTNDEKDARQTRWKKNQTRVMVSTNAFGMGIDKPDVRVVVHLDLPDSLEAYFQEAGRAGRDEKKAYAVLLYNKSDRTKIKNRITNSFPPKDKIRQIYNYLGNYLELAQGAGEGVIYPFQLNDFCSKFKLPILPTYSALKILQQAEYLELTDELDNPSRLMITVRKEDLYSNHLNNLKLEKILHMLLRSYTGLFTEYAHINEDVLAKRLNISRQEVYEQLMLLSKLCVLSYIPAKKTPFIIYTCHRIDYDRIHLPKSIYDDRKERAETRTNAMIRYATEENSCRSRLLLSYFGQTSVSDCGQCDICLKKKENITPEELDEISHSIINLLKEKPQTESSLIFSIHAKNKKKILETIRALSDRNKISINNEGLISLK